MQGRPGVRGVVGRVLLRPALCVALALTAVSCGEASDGESSPAPVPDTAAVPAAVPFAPGPTTLMRGVHLLGALSPSVVYAIETSDGIVLIDSGQESDCSRLLPQLAELQLDARAIRKVLITHAHGDHTFGARFLRERVGAAIFAGARDSEVLRRGSPREAVFSNYFAPGLVVRSTPVDVELQGGETIVSGDTRIEAIATPGHSPGSMCYLLERDGRRLLFAGDVIMTLAGDLGTYTAYLPPLYRGDAAEYLATLRRLKELDPPDLVLPGHPFSETHRGASDPSGRLPAVTPERWNALLDGGIAEMRELLRRYESDGHDFLDGTPREILPDLYYLGDVEREAVYCLRSGSRLFLFNAPGGPDLVGLLESRLGPFDLSLSELSAVLLTTGEPDGAAGTRAVVDRCGCAVVTTPAIAEEIAGACPPGTRVLAGTDADVLPEGVEIVAPEGAGTAPQAYVLRTAGKTVVVTGRVPLMYTSNPAPMRALLQLLDGPTADAADYVRALDALERLEPDVWLPSRPVPWQNANVYDGLWQRPVIDTRRSIREALQRR